MSIEAVLKKVRGLRALATSSNVNEAAAAAAAADRLIQEHRLSEAELESAGGPCEAIGEDATPIDAFQGRRLVSWKSTLCQVLTEHYGCACYFQRIGGLTGMHIVGRPSDLAAVRDMYAWLTLEIERLVATNASGRAGKNGYRLGAVVGIREALLRSTKATGPTTGAPTGSAAMVLQGRAEEASRWMNAAHEMGKPDKSKLSVTDAAAFMAGRKAGANIHLGASLETGGPRALTA